MGEVVKQENVDSFFQNIVDDIRAKGKQLQLVVVVLPSKGGHVYDKVKHIGDVKHKVPTQCVIKKNLSRLAGWPTIRCWATSASRSTQSWEGRTTPCIATPVLKS